MFQSHVGYWIGLPHVFGVETPQIHRLSIALNAVLYLLYLIYIYVA